MHTLNTHIEGRSLTCPQFVEALHRHARHHPETPAVGGGDGVCTYGELSRLVAERTAVLARRLSPGQVVIAVLPAGAEYVSWFCAAIAAGVRFLPMHPQVAGPEAVAVAERAGAIATIVGSRLPSAAALEHLDLRIKPELGDREDIPGLGAVVLGSSGTTGMPKLAVRPGGSLDADAAAVIHGLSLEAADRVLFATPLSHSYGVDMMVATLTAGAALCVQEQFDPEALLQEVEQGGTILAGVPFIFESLARRAVPRGCRLRIAVSAGSTLPERVRESFRGGWGVEIGQLYGATELGTVAVNLPGTPGFEPGSVGRPLPGVSARVVDAADATQEVAAGAEGHLAVRAPSMLSGYLDADLPLIDGHVLTGDLARIDRDQRIWITGRLKHLIDVGAYKVNPLEVEGVLSLHPGVAECVVVPVAASETVNRLKAVVVPRPSAQAPTPAMLRDFLRERLSPIKVPRQVEIVASLPKSATGKILRDHINPECR